MYRKTLIALFAALISLFALNVVANETNDKQTTSQSPIVSSTSGETGLSFMDKFLVLLGLSDDEKAIKGTCDSRGCCERHCGLGKIR